MKLPSMVLAAGLVFASSAAFAFHCPKDMKQIDAALPNAKLSSVQMADLF